MPGKKRWKLLNFLGHAIPLLLVVYVLSVGPAFAVAEDSVFSRGPDVIYLGYVEFFNSFYAPLLWVGEKVQPIDDKLNTYMDFCLFSMYPNHFSEASNF